MKQINVYGFAELSSDVQDKVLAKMWDINVDADWWDSMCEDAKEVAIQIYAFNTDHGTIKVKYIEDAITTAEKILTNHGDMCETFKLAQAFKADMDVLVEKYSDGIRTDIVAEGNEYDFDNECDELEKEFLRALGEEYLSLLRQEYEFLTSRVAIVETIEANEYTFLEDGTQV